MLCSSCYLFSFVSFSAFRLFFAHSSNRLIEFKQIITINNTSKINSCSSTIAATSDSHYMTQTIAVLVLHIFFSAPFSRHSHACLFSAPLAPPLLTFQHCNNSDPCHDASAPPQRATPLCKMPHTLRNNVSDGLLNIWSLTSSRRASADTPVTAARACKAEQNLSIMPPKHPLRCTSEPYRLANGQREEGPFVWGKLSRGSRLQPEPIRSRASTSSCAWMDQYAHTLLSAWNIYRGNNFTKKSSFLNDSCGKKSFGCQFTDWFFFKTQQSKFANKEQIKSLCTNLMQ